MTCQRDQKWVLTLSASPPSPLSGLPPPCCKIPLLEQGVPQKGLPVQGSGGDTRAAVPVVALIS